MIVIIHSDLFDRKLSRATTKVQYKIAERVNLFIADKFNELLNNHGLHGEYSGCISINISGDVRLILKEMGDDKYKAVDFGTHSQLFE